LVGTEEKKGKQNIRGSITGPVREEQNEGDVASKGGEDTQLLKTNLNAGGKTERGGAQTKPGHPEATREKIKKAMSLSLTNKN